MNIVAYTQIHRTAIHGTGISRHAVNMIRGLADTPGINLRVAASCRDLVDGTRIGPESGLAGMPVIPLPFSFQTLERLWWFTHWPAIETWTGPVDWVYCPADAYIPTKKARLAVTIHDVAWLETSLPWSSSPEHRRFRRRLRLKMQPLLKSATVFLAASHFTKQRLIELLGIPAHRIAYIGNGVEEQFFIDRNTPPPRPASAPHAPYILMVGGLSERKGARQAALLAEALAARLPDFVVAVAGSSEPAWVTRTKKFRNILHLGYVPPADLPALMHHAIALYFPSRYEGFGIPVIEAMAALTPAIVAPHAALPEVVASAGVVVADDQPEETADVVHALATDRTFREERVAAGRMHAMAFTWRACVNRLTAELERE